MPLVIPLVIFLLLLIVFVVLSFFILFHLLNFGFLGDMTKAMAGFYVLLALIIFVPTFIYMISIPWVHGSINFDLITLPFIK